MECRQQDFHGTRISLVPLHVYLIDVKFFCSTEKNLKALKVMDGWSLRKGEKG